MIQVRRTFAFSVLSLLLGAALFLMSCNQSGDQQQTTTDADAQAQQLIEQAKAELETASELYESETCDNRQRATETLLKVDMIIEQVNQIKTNKTSQIAASNIAKMADDKYHQYIRAGYAAECCWAVGLIIRCAEDHIHTLQEPQMANLQEVKSRYKHKCVSGPIQTAMLTL